MPTEQDVKFSDFIRGLPAASESDLSAGNNMPVVRSGDVKKIDGEILDYRVSTVIECNQDNADYNVNLYIPNTGSKYNKNYSSSFYSVKKGDKITIKANSTNYAVYAFVNSVPNMDGETIDYAAGETGRHDDIFAGTEKTFVSPDDCFLYVFMRDTYIPEYVFRKPFVNVSDLKKELENTPKQEYFEKYLNERNAFLNSLFFIPASVNNYKKQYSSSFYSVKRGDKITIKANSTNYAVYAFVKSLPINDGDMVVYATGEAGRHDDILAGTEKTIASPDDCYLYIFTRSEYKPEYVYKIEQLEVSFLYGEIKRLEQDFDFFRKTERLNGKAIVSENSYILGLGASYMRGDSTGVGIKNVWLNLLGESIGCAGVYNDALGGTNICYHANRLFDGTILADGFAPIADVDAVIIMHCHDKDVFTIDPIYANYSVEDYESSGLLPFAETSGKEQDDSVYALAFDYVIKKIKKLYYEYKTGQEYVSEIKYYMGDYVPKPCQIVLATNWHGIRDIYNTTVRKLAVKWSLPLIRFDDKIGFSKDMLNPSTNAQPSFEFVGNIGGPAPIEVVDGVAYGWHAMCGGRNVFIQRKIASIAKESFDLI